MAFLKHFTDTVSGLILVLLLAVLAPLSAEATTVPLRGLADDQGIHIGAAAATGELVDGVSEPQYANLFKEQFNMLTVANFIKWAYIHPERNRYDFTLADPMVEFAAENSMEVRGHTLVWHNRNPEWLTNGTFTSDELKAILEDHIKTVVGHFRDKYPGTVVAWDVVNEAVDDDGSLRETLWSKIGPTPDEYIKLAFKWAHEADPNAKLYYNDYGMEWKTAKSIGVYNLVKRLKDEGVPIDGVGFQSHFTTPQLSVPDFETNMRQYGNLGLETSLTELDVMINASDGISQAELDSQAKAYSSIATMCLNEPSCKAIVLWGLTDKYSWRAAGVPLIFDASYQPKPAYFSLNEALGGTVVAPPAPSTNSLPTVTGVPTRLEAESLTNYTGYIVRPEAGSLLFKTNGTVSQKFNFTSTALHAYTISARGTYAGNGWPIMNIKVDGTKIGSIRVDSSTNKEFTIAAMTTAGTHTVSYEYSNDYFTSSADRNLYLDAIEVASVPPVPVHLEAESLTNYTGYIVRPEAGSLLFKTNGTVSHTFDFASSGNHELRILAKGNLVAGGWPVIKVRVDGISVATVVVDSSEIKTFALSIPASMGKHVITLAYVNDYFISPSADRNLSIDAFEIFTK